MFRRTLDVSQLFVRKGQLNLSVLIICASCVYSILQCGQLTILRGLYDTFMNVLPYFICFLIFMKCTENILCVNFKNNIFPVITLFLPIRGGHFAIMETVTRAIRFFKHIGIIIGNS